MEPLDQLIDPLRHSPRLPQAVELLSRQLADEQARRLRFYDQISPEEKAEFIDGELVMHSPARSRHLDATLRIGKLLDTFATLHQLGSVKVGKCLCVFPRNDYEPDVIFFGNEKSALITDNTMKFPVPDLVVEVLSESTQSRDRGVKFEDYQANGVAEYWIVDADSETIEQYILAKQGYELLTQSRTGKIVCQAIADFVLDVPSCFDATANLAAIRSMLES